MPDVFANITEAPRDVLDVLVRALEMRAATPQLQGMLDAYLSEVDLPADANALEVGCGTGPVARRLIRVPNVASVVGLDPSPIFLAEARNLAEDVAGLTFEEGNARALPFDDASFDLVVFHTLLCHVPEADAAIAEARRVLRPGGTLAVFDCDFSTASLSTGDFDPFAAIVAVMVETIVHDRWFVRGLTGRLARCGFEPGPLRSYGYVEHPEPNFMLSWIERGGAALRASGRIGEAGLEALRAEAARRVDEREWYGYVAFASVIARKPA